MPGEDRQLEDVPGVKMRTDPDFNMPNLMNSSIIRKFTAQYELLFTQPVPGNLGACSVADNKNIFFVKGDRVHIEIGLGPITDSDGNLPWFQTSTPSPGS